MILSASDCSCYSKWTNLKPFIFTMDFKIGRYNRKLYNSVLGIAGNFFWTHHQKLLAGI